MKILFLSFFFEPDLCAGSFRNTYLFKQIVSKLGQHDEIHVLTTSPNRYSSYIVGAKTVEKGLNYRIERIKVPKTDGTYWSQMSSFLRFYIEVFKRIKHKKYDLVYASSSRLFTAFLGKRVSQRKKVPLYLDVRDIFVDSINAVLNKGFFLKPLIYLLSQIEKYTFSNARHINLVSEGFLQYFSKYTKPTYSYYTNGIDDIFLKKTEKDRVLKSRDKINITYAGNIGAGQGLEKIIPALAERLAPHGYHFTIIGDGGQRKKLEQTIIDMRLQNVDLLSPVPQDELIEKYQQSDFLFLHLNNLDAFKKVIPSKVFEYAAFNKPIIAGVAGFAASFIAENIPNAILFPPTDLECLVTQLFEYEYKEVERNDFKNKYSRKAVMEKMAISILNIVK